MSWQSELKEYLSLTRKDRIGILVIFFLILITLIVPKFVANSVHQPEQADTSWMAALQKLEIRESEKEFSKYEGDENSDDHFVYRKSNEIKGELFQFDPNELSVEEWIRLGVKEKTATTIRKFISKGGKFRKTEDLRKIYGLSPSMYERLAPYVQIKRREDFVRVEYEKEKITTPNRNAVIDINSADTTAFINLPGIGSKLAGRIVSFREKLGGFYSIDQVKETFGLQDSVFQKIKQYLKLDNIFLRKININSATVDELKAHPYIRSNIAVPLVAYRNEHGPFTQIDEIKKVMVITDLAYLKMLPYLVLQ